MNTGMPNYVVMDVPGANKHQQFTQALRSELKELQENDHARVIGLLLIREEPDGSLDLQELGDVDEVDQATELAPVNTEELVVLYEPA